MLQDTTYAKEELNAECEPNLIPRCRVESLGMLQILEAIDIRKMLIISAPVCYRNAIYSQQLEQEHD
jgi:hypothetical protein